MPVISFQGISLCFALNSLLEFFAASPIIFNRSDYRVLLFFILVKSQLD
jgi:hypothetical protein